jgi:CheY-like chemotaxis protein
MNNLLGNAFKFTYHGIIEFGIKNIEYTKKITFYVKDTGIGIEKKHFNFIFNRFAKIDEDRTTLYRGLGLGLAITKHLVQQLGGEIGLSSEKNKGSEFVFTLPFAGNETEIISQENNPQSINIMPDWSNKTFLIADDEDTNLIMIKNLLQKTNVKIYEATNGEEAVEKFISHQFEIDMVLVDIKMPVKDGIEVLNEIKQINNSVIVIAQTAYAMANEELEIRKAGFDDYIAKPILAGNLFNLLSKYIT